jgi:hypothetical protein
MEGISLLAEDLLASQEGLCSMELVSFHTGFMYATLTMAELLTKICCGCK